MTELILAILIGEKSSPNYTWSAVLQKKLKPRTVDWDM